MMLDSRDGGHRRSNVRRVGLTVVAALAAVVPVTVAGGAPAGAASSTLTVTTAAADGPGSLLAAFDLASADRSVRKIVVSPSVVATPITPAESLVYSGSQPLVVDGNGVTIRGNGDPIALEPTPFLSFGAGESPTIGSAAGPHDTVLGIELITPADVTLKELSIENTDYAITQRYATGSKRAVRLRMFDVTARARAAAFLSLDDREGLGTYLISRRTELTSDVLGIYAQNKGGNMSFDMKQSTVDGGELGIFAYELGGGALIVNLSGVDLWGRNELVGFAGGGSRLNLTNVTADELISVSHLGSGHLRANITNLTSTGADGALNISENGPGNLVARLRNVSHDPSGPGSGLARSVALNEHGAGKLDATISRLMVGGSVRNVEQGVVVSQGSPGVGRVRVVGSDLSSTLTPFEINGVARFTEVNNILRLPVP